MPARGLAALGKKCQAVASNTCRLRSPCVRSSSVGDACETDDDNDGVPDGQDAFPLDPAEVADTDGDRVGDNADVCPDVRDGACGTPVPAGDTPSR